MKILATLFLSIIAIPILYAQEISGVVIDQETKQPIADVHVWVGDMKQLQSTNQKGEFNLEDVQTGTELVATALGYGTVNQIIDKPSGALIVELEPSAITLHQGIIVTPGRQEERAFDSPEAITVLSAKEINQLSPRTTPEALMGATGVWVQKTNHGGGSPFVRGLTGHQTLIMIDGVRLNNATFRSGPNQYLNTFDPFTLQRIEVLRNNGSVQYGTDALGGVLNLLTRQPNFTGGEFAISSGLTGQLMSDGMEKTVRANVNAANDQVAILAGITYSDFGDIKAGGALGKLNPTGYNQMAADMKVRLKLSQNLELTGAYQYLNQENVPVYHKVALENYTVNSFDPQRRQLGYLKAVYKTSNQWLENILLTVSRHSSLEQRREQKNDSPQFTLEEDKVISWGTNLSIQSNPAEFWSFNTGIDFYSDLVNSVTVEINRELGETTLSRGLYPDGSTLQNFGFYNLHTLDWEKVQLQAGVRFNAFQIEVNDVTLGATQLTPSAVVGNLSVLYRLNENHHLVTSFNTGFRAPNIDDLGSLGIVDFRYEQPAFDLEPEKSASYEIGYKTSFDKFGGSLFLFRNNLTDLISRIQMNDSIQGYPVYQKVNIGEAFIQGVEAAAEYKLLDQLMVYGNLTYTYGQNVASDEPMRRIPPLNGRLGLYYQQAHNWWGRVDWLSAATQDRLASGDISDNRIPAGGTPGWNLLNISLGYRVNFWEVNLTLQNLFNELYKTHGSGVYGYGRSFVISTRLDLNLIR